MKASRAILSTLAAIAILLSALQANIAFVQITGAKQGAIKGSVSQKGREGTIRASEISHEIVSPRDPASGLPTGRRQHKPFTVKLELDRATPLLFNSLVNNEILTDVTIRFWKPSNVGVEVNHFNVKLTNASVASIKMIHPDSTPDSIFTEAIEVGFTYQKIEWTWTDGGITAMDDWEFAGN